MAHIKTNVCNDCIFCEKERIVGSNGKPFFNFQCNHDTISPRYIDLSMQDNGNIETPYWCPLTDGNTTVKPKIEKRVLNPQMMWWELKPKVKWDDIVEKEVYHVPPYLGETKRRDIRIVYKCKDYFTWRDVNDDPKDYTNIHTCYSSTTLYKVMVKKMND